MKFVLGALNREAKSQRWFDLGVAAMETGRQGIRKGGPPVDENDLCGVYGQRPRAMKIAYTKALEALYKYLRPYPQGLLQTGGLSPLRYATLRDLGPLPLAEGTKRISIRLPNASATRRNIASECPS